MVYRLSRRIIAFPDPALAEEDGLLAVGGDLSVERLVLAYANGIFPWYEPGEEYLWWCPRERYIIRPDHIHVSHSMGKFLRRHDVRMELNRDYADTMHRCRMKREAEGTWITDEMELAYLELHRRGLATSVEAFVDGQLAGGLYGVSLKNCFFGESMFSDMENGSKAALILFARQAAEKGMPLIDCQFHTPHLESMGGEKITYIEYMELVKQGLEA
ncbi:MAG: leucyl/phenylalanyl-tRNA--protein transferase [Clostridia bacterium]|nr:leucyl/phenylalanyl-tRNA--protein transferase [Clostridia bacterium]